MTVRARPARETNPGPLGVFRDRDIWLRLAAALLPQRQGYALTKRWAARSDPARFEWVASVVAQQAERLLQDPELAAAAARGFVPEVACDDLDAVTAVVWPRVLRRRWTDAEGTEHLPASGPVLLVSFHFSGGLRVFEALGERRTTFLLAENRPGARRYLRVLESLRRRYFRRVLEPPWIATGEGARERLREHLDRGGALVALLDVAPVEIGLRDHVVTELFGRPLRLPVGLLRLAASKRIPVVPFAGRIENGRRVIRFHAAIAGDDPIDLLERVLRSFADIIREQPETWQGWLDVDRLFTVAEAPRDQREA
jgi:lauroyl/myristoyl acyltransferase